MNSEAAAVQQVIAAWVQAIGSVLAIGAAFLVVWLQTRAAAKLRRSDMLDRLEGIAAVLGIARRRADEMHQRALTLPADKGRKFLGNAIEIRVRVAFAAVEEISIGSAHTAVSAEAVIDARTAVKDSRPFIPRADGVFHADHEPELMQIVIRLGDAESNVRSEVRRLTAST